MALPGVRTVLSDRFYTLSRTDVPDGPRVVAIGTRITAYDPDSAVPVQDFDPYTPRSEREVITAFGYGSQLHRAYLEIMAGGAGRVTLVALPEGTEDPDLLDDTDGNIFDMAFEAAEIIQPDIIVPWGRGSNSSDWETPATPGNDLELGFHADNDAGLEASLVRRVANKCKEITDRSNPCFAVMGVSPIPADTENVTAADMAAHFALTGLTDHDDVDFGDAGSYVAVVAAEVRPVGYPVSFGYSNGAGMLAGQLASLDASAAVTGRGLLNVAGLRYAPTRVQQQRLIDAGVIPVGLDFNRNAIWVDGQTFGRASSDFGRLTTLRIVFDAMQRVRNKAQTFVGQAATLHMKNSLDTAISSALRAMKENGSLTDGTHVVTYIPRENRAVIDLVLQPVFELRNIDITISVNL